MQQQQLVVGWLFAKLNGLHGQHIYKKRKKKEIITRHRVALACFVQRNNNNAKQKPVKRGKVNVNH